MVNQVFLIGRLVRDPELFETTNKTEVAKITLAIQKGYKNQDGIYEADYIPIIPICQVGFIYFFQSHA